MRAGVASTVLVLLTAGCASSAQTEGQGSGESVQLTVINESITTVTAYVIWGSGRVRLGEVGQGRTRIFTPELRGDQVSVGLEALGGPPPATSRGNLTQGLRQSESFAVVNGDALEFRLSAAGLLTVRRLEAGL
jgi:hypothetical protein